MESIIELVELFTDFFDSLGGAFSSADGAFLSFESILTAIAAIITAIVTLIGLIVEIGAALFGVASTVVAAVVSIVGAVATAAFFIAKYLLRAIPAYKIAKTANCKLAWLVWIPFFQPLLCTFVLSRVSGKEEFELINGKLKIKEGLIVMLVYALVYFFADAIVTGILLFANVIPIVGQIVSLLGVTIYYVPEIFLGIIEYVYLRDTLDVFKENKKKNQVHSFIITVLDIFITSGWARVVYLITMMRLKPLEKTQPEVTAEEDAVVEGELVLAE